MAKQRKRRAKEPTATEAYTDPEGNVLTLRASLSPGSIRKIAKAQGKAGATAEDAFARREEMLFERLVVSWEIAGLPLEDQKLLLGRYRMSSTAERDWVRRTIAHHLEAHIPELMP